MTLPRGLAAKPDHYLTAYEHWFAPYQHEPITLMELGVHTGGSMRMWRQWFTKARIIGVDHIRQTEDIEGVELVWTTQTDPALAEYRPDIVIDDASHIWGYTIASFHNLKEAPVYAIEDLHVAYLNDSEWSGGRNPMDLIEGLVDDMHENPVGTFYQTIVQYPGLVIMVR